jgi:methionine synthase II (cobalamin-independent)
MRDEGKVLLVGSVARPEDGWSVEDVLRHAAGTLGEYVTMLPDGEIGDRSTWINFIARRVFPGHPDLITTSRHTYEDWKPSGYGDLWRVTVRDGVDSIHIDKIGYADEAKESYATFTRLRDEGVIPNHVRFMVALPLTESGTRGFVNNARDFEILWAAYSDALGREIADIVESIPPSDLTIQFDLARETAAVEGLEFQFPNADLKTLPSDPLERYCHALSELAPAVPADVWLGLHVCYGSLEHKEGESPDSGHYVPIKDLGTAVKMLNAGARACERQVDFAHAPVQFAEGLNDSHYAPLSDLDIGGARLYLGLVDSSDGVEGALARADVAQRHLSDFGVGTACGWGRRPLSESVEGLLELEERVAEQMWGVVSHQRL